MKIELDKDGFTHIPQKYYDLFVYLGTDDWIKENKQTREEIKERWHEFSIKKYYKVFKEKEEIYKGLDRLPEIELMRLCREDRLCYQLFCLNTVMRPFQLFLNDVAKKHRRICLVSFRRAGKSVWLKAEQLFLFRWNKHPTVLEGTWINIFCLGKDEVSKLHIMPLYALMRQGDNAVKENFNGEFGPNFFTENYLGKRDKRGGVTKTEIAIDFNDVLGDEETYKNGQTCKILASLLENTAVGVGGSVFGDEVAKWDTGKGKKLSNGIDFFQRVLFPIFSEKPEFSCVLTSTPEGFDNLFEYIVNSRHKNPRYDFVVVTVPFWKSHNKTQIEEKRLQRDVATQEGEDSLLNFEQEQECRFVQSSNQYFKQKAHLQHFFTSDLHFTDNNSSNLNAVVVDWGGTESKGVILCGGMDDKGDIIVYKYEKYERNQTLKMMIDIDVEIANFNAKYFGYDSRGAGNETYAKIEIKYSENMRIAINFSERVELYEDLRKSMLKSDEPGRIRCPFNEQTARELRNITKKLKMEQDTIRDDVPDCLAMLVKVLKLQEGSANVVRYEEYEEKDYEDPTEKKLFSQVNPFGF